ADRLRSPIGAVADAGHMPRFEPAQLRLLDRVSQLALAASAQAITAAGIDFGNEQPERCGVSVGTSLGGAATTDAGYEVAYGQDSERIRPYSVLAAMSNAPASWIGMQHQLTGPNLTYSTACSSSAVALGEAARRIQSGDADIIIAGGAEAPLALGVMLAWDALRVLAVADPANPARSCRPFSADRSGLVLGEGAAFFVLEQWDHAVARKAHIRAELSGYGLATDVAHITRPSVAGQSRAMRAALRSASLHADQIDYVNAHGTGTPQNDAVETAALKEVFGPRAYGLPVSSTKSMHGHLLGAAGALEFMIAVIAMERGVVPPTMHLDSPDPACDLDYVAGEARHGVSLRAVMSSSFAFGGTNAVLIAQQSNHNL
ncbi:MAG: beta-ketoacyl-[acyl-carrier-protein] synthase family protein, partial [Steroidobacteraceae bacterium]